jgi:hypothetical protein
MVGEEDFEEPEKRTIQCNGIKTGCIKMLLADALSDPE